MRKRRTFRPEFKAKVVLECISGVKSVSEACGNINSARYWWVNGGLNSLKMQQPSLRRNIKELKTRIK